MLVSVKSLFDFDKIMVVDDYLFIKKIEVKHDVNSDLKIINLFYIFKVFTKIYIFYLHNKCGCRMMIKFIK